jgi:hypothetical protein
LFHSPAREEADTSRSKLFNLHGNRRQTGDLKMSEKKVVRRTVALALGVICILLIAGLGGAIAYYDSEYKSLNSQNTNLQATNDQLQTWLNGNKTLLNQTQTWFDNNITYYNSQISSLDSQIINLTNEKNQLQTWLNGNIPSLEAQISTLNATIAQLEACLTRGIPTDHLRVANTVQAWYPTINLTKQFLFNCIDQDGTESNWVWLWVNGSISDAAAFMSIIIKPANTSIEFCRCDGGVSGENLSISINGAVHNNIFFDPNETRIGYWSG